MTRDDLIQTCLVSVSASGFGAAIAVACRTGFKPADLLAFVGAIIGAAATVAGTAWLQDRSVTRERREEQGLIREEVDTLLEICQVTLQHDPHDGPWSAEWRAAFGAAADVFNGSARFFLEVRQYNRTLNFYQRECIGHLWSVLSSFNDRHHRIFDLDQEADPYDDWSWPGVIEGIRSDAAITLTSLHKT